MYWSTLNFGKHKGKTLPQVIFTDPDWFYWALKEDAFKGPLKGEAVDLALKAKSIRIPNNAAGNLVAEYVIHLPTGKFSHMQIVPKDRPHHQGSSPTFRKDVIDLSVARQIAPYDKLGCGMLISSAKFALFGNKSARMSRSRCDDFFGDLHNFEL